MALRHLPENPRQQARAWNLQLGVPGFKYADLNRVRRVEALDRAFIAELQTADPALAADFMRYRDSCGKDRDRLQESHLLIKVAPHIGTFIARLFHIDNEHRSLCERVRADQVVFKWKRNFVERYILKNPPHPDELARMDPVELEFAYREVIDEMMPDASLTSDPERELAVVSTTLQDTTESPVASGETREASQARLTIVQAWVRALAYHPALAQRRKKLTSLHIVHKTDYNELVPRIRPRADLPEFFMGKPESRRHRDGFDLTDSRYTPRENLREAHYCLTCHERAKDSCSTGLHDKDGDDQPNPLGHPARGLSARRKDLRNDRALPRRPSHRRAGGDNDRQPDARGHRAIASATTA